MELLWRTNLFSVRLKTDTPRKLRVIWVPNGRECASVSRPKKRHDTGARLMDQYVRIDLVQPHNGERTFYTHYHNVKNMTYADYLKLGSN